MRATGCRPVFRLQDNRARRRKRKNGSKKIASRLQDNRVRRRKRKNGSRKETERPWRMFWSHGSHNGGVGGGPPPYVGLRSLPRPDARGLNIRCPLEIARGTALPVAMSPLCHPSRTSCTEHRTTGATPGTSGRKLMSPDSPRPAPISFCRPVGRRIVAPSRSPTVPGTALARSPAPPQGGPGKTSEGDFTGGSGGSWGPVFPLTSLVEWAFVGSCCLPLSGLASYAVLCFLAVVAGQHGPTQVSARRGTSR